MIRKLRKLFLFFTRESKVWWYVFYNARTPQPVKMLLGFTILYVLMPFDVSPDYIPILGILDDAVVLPVILSIAKRMTPDSVLSESRKKAGIAENED